MRVLAPVLLVALTAACTQGDSAEERTVSRDATPAASDIDGGRVDLGGYELAYEVAAPANRRSSRRLATIRPERLPGPDS